ncbi:MAG: 1-acyl-sn-glycerol-3-phosphate acyltransferase [Chitinophagales bacterium]
MSLKHEINEHGEYNFAIPKLEDWPIHDVGQQRTQFIEDYIVRSKERIREVAGSPKKLHDILARTRYLEEIRIKEEPWRIDPKDDWNFWHKKVKKVLLESATQHNHEKGLSPAEEEVFHTIISRYAEEIVGLFRPKTYHVASKLLPRFISRLLNAFSSRKFWKIKYRLKDRLKITGQIELIRELSLKGTIVVVPTHFSNLDSILVGWSLHTIGLPAFLYGAGLNLFNSRMFGYFMSRLGAYRIDRRKKNPIYMETLKMYSQITVERGCHSLFFPGGTRSRSGSLESRLKLGLLGTIVEAQRRNFVDTPPKYGKEPKNRGNKIFIVPLVLNYHFVLEAKRLIEQHLKQSGKEKYFIDKDVFPSSKKAYEFLNSMMGERSEVSLSFGRPMDIFGHSVDANGDSLDPQGNKIDIANYFVSNGKMGEDKQRDQEYTRLLGEQILKQFYQHNIVISSDLISFIAFEILKKRNPQFDIFGLLRLPEEKRVIAYDEFVAMIEKIRKELNARAKRGELQVADHLNTDIHRLINHGLSNIGLYHTERPIRKTEKGDITSDNMNLLYYYHNHLLGYELEKLI